MRCSAGPVYVVQIDSRKPVLHHADYTAPTLQHELVDHTTDQEYICPVRYLDHKAKIDDDLLMICPMCKKG